MRWARLFIFPYEHSLFIITWKLKAETFLISARIGLAMYEKKAFPKKDSEGETGLQQSEENKKSVCMYKLCFNQA